VFVYELLLIVLLLSAPVVVMLSANAMGAADINKAGTNAATVNNLLILLSIYPPMPAKQPTLSCTPKRLLKRRIKKLQREYSFTKLISVKINTNNLLIGTRIY